MQGYSADAQSERTHELILEGLEDVDAGRLIEHDDILAWVASLRGDPDRGAAIP
jgi:predicted transcriptional regulator